MSPPMIQKLVKGYMIVSSQNMQPISSVGSVYITVQSGL